MATNAEAGWVCLVSVLEAAAEEKAMEDLLLALVTQTRLDAGEDVVDQSTDRLLVLAWLGVCDFHAVAEWNNLDCQWTYIGHK